MTYRVKVHVGPKHPLNKSGLALTRQFDFATIDATKAFTDAMDEAGIEYTLPPGPPTSTHFEAIASVYHELNKEFR